MAVTEPSAGTPRGAARTRTTSRAAHEGILRRQAPRESAARTYARVAARSSRCAPAGMTVEGADGRRYLDCLSGAGHPRARPQPPRRPGGDPRRPRLRRAAARARPRHPGQGRLHHGAVRDAAAGARRPRPDPVLRPGRHRRRRGGVKLVRTATGRAGLLAFTGAYHGMTAGALAATATPRSARRARRRGVTRLPYPYDYRCPFGVGGERGARTRRALDRAPARRPQGRRAAARRDDPRTGAGRGRGDPRARRLAAPDAARSPRTAASR